VIAGKFLSNQRSQFAFALMKGGLKAVSLRKSLANGCIGELVIRFRTPWKPIIQVR
jgi:hypothetical protein